MRIFNWSEKEHFCCSSILAHSYSLQGSFISFKNMIPVRAQFCDEIGKNNWAYYDHFDLKEHFGILFAKQLNK